MNRILVLGVLASAVFVTTASAQSFPFAKRGLRRIQLDPGASIQVGQLAGDSGISLRFAEDADFGVKLDGITHRGTPPGAAAPVDYTFLTQTFDGSSRALWNAIFRTVQIEDPFLLQPSDAGDFDVWVDDPSAPNQALFRWDDLCLTGINCANHFWMELRVTITGGRSEWDSRMGRIAARGSDIVTLEEVRAPIVYTCQPSLNTRVLVPTQGPFDWAAPNLPISFLAARGALGLELEHPARGQQMQFSAMYDAPNADKILYFGTEDTDGVYKRFHHEIVGPLPNCFYKWCQAYFPVYGPSPYLNFHRSPYPVVVCALTAKSPAFWYDVAEHYREFVDERLRPTPIESRFYRANKDFTDAAVLVATSTPDLETLSPTQAEQMFETFVDQALRLRAALPGADGSELPTFMEWQKWLLGDATLPDIAPELPGDQFENPAGPGFSPAPAASAEIAKNPSDSAQAAIARARAEGINMSAYTIPVVIDRSDWPSFRSDWILRDRNFVELEELPGAFGSRVDFGNFAVPFWMTGVLYDNVLRDTPDFGGVFLDVLSGGGSSNLRYPSDPRLLFRRRFNGGDDYTDGVERFLRLLRARMRFGKPWRAQHPDVPWIGSEVRNEFIADELDFAQHSLNALPGQLQLAQFFDLVGGIAPSNIIPEASMPSPPMWNLVYHEYSRADGLTTQLQTKGPDLFPGLWTYDLWGDYNRMTYAMFWNQGMKWGFQYIGAANEAFELLVDTPGGVSVRNPANPEQVNLLGFLQRMQEALSRDEEAGKFLNSGRMERPLQVPRDPGSGIPLAYVPFLTSQTPSPSIQTGQLAAATAGLPNALVPFASQHFYESPFTTASVPGLEPLLQYNVPNVVHNVWRSTDGSDEIGLVFVNWADAPGLIGLPPGDFPSAFVGTIDPALYEGLGNTFEIVGVRPDGAGVTEYVVATCTGPTTISWGANPLASVTLQHHSEPAPNPFGMPPRSVQVFKLRSVGN